MYHLKTRGSAAAVATALVLGTLSIPAPQAAADPECTAAHTVSIFTYNDFHGRIGNAAALFTPVEAARASQGEGNVALISTGDDIGGSTFESMADNDNPTLAVLAAAELDAYTVGNHEFDKGWADLSGRVSSAVSPIPLLGANVYAKGTTSPISPLQPYTTFTLDGLEVAVVGAVTGDLGSLVSPAGISQLSIGDPVAAINDVVATLPADIDLVIASIHEGAPSGSGTGSEQASANPNFAAMWNGLDPRVDVVLNGHTHQTYSWTNDKGQLFTQAGSYGTVMNELQAGVTAAGTLCGVSNTSHKIDPKAFDVSYPRIQKIKDIVDAAVLKADVIGSTVIGMAEQAISTPTGNADIRSVESPMSNLVAQMFAEVLGGDNPEFIGIQNPGGTRDSFDQGEITYKEAALTLPFANSLMTTQITGEQFKKVLEQQWQRDSSGNVPSRAFLRLGLSSNVSYTYDESRPEGDRILSIFINGSPIEPAKLYTVGSGSFLIAGGDNFRELANGVGTKDSGRVDLEAWTSWVKEQGTLKPHYLKRGLSLIAAPTSLTPGNRAEVFSFDISVADPKSVEGIDFLLGEAAGSLPRDPAKVSPSLPNTTVTATIGSTVVGSAAVSEGKARVPVAIPADCSVKPGNHVITFTFEPSKTTSYSQVTVTGEGSTCAPIPQPPSQSPKPSKPKPGLPGSGS